MLNPESVAVIAVFLAAQTGALVFFAGAVSVTLKMHARELKALNEFKEEAAETLTILRVREGIES